MKCSCVVVEDRNGMQGWLNATHSNELAFSSEFCDSNIKCVVNLAINCVAAFAIVFLTYAKFIL